jgi:general secretion pathway protein I
MRSRPRLFQEPMTHRRRQPSARPEPPRAVSGRRARAGGFTLLEVMVSLGILAVALLAIGGVNSGAVRMHAYAKQLTVATNLARGKLLDVQTQLRKDGLGDFSRAYSGTFSDEGEPTYKWRAQVIKPEIDLDPARLLEMASGALGMGTNADGTKGQPGQPDPANPLTGGPMAGLIQGQLTSMIELLKSSVREIKLTIMWKSGAAEESFELVEHVVILPNARQNAAQNAQPTVPGMNGQGGPLGANPLPPGMTPPPVLK